MSASHHIHILPDTAPIVSDEALDHWAAVYAETPWLARRGVLFDTFVRHPHEILAIGLDAPLPVQVRIGRAWCETAEPAPARDTPAEPAPEIHEVEVFNRRVEVLMAGRRAHVSDGRSVEPITHPRKNRRRPTTHRPWRLESAR